MRPVELLIGRLLRVGVATSIAVVATGLVLSFVHHPSWLGAQGDLPSLIRPGHAVVHSVPAALRYAAHGRGRGIVTLGLLILIATPVLRVALSIAGFARMRDTTFVLITSGVLALLLISFVLGRAGG